MTLEILLRITVSLRSQMPPLLASLTAPALSTVGLVSQPVAAASAWVITRCKWADPIETDHLGGSASRRYCESNREQNDPPQAAKFP